MTPTLILASNSPRRRQLLALTGWSFAVQPVDIDESPFAAEPPDDYVMRLAESKARAAARLAKPGQVVLAADTTVADGMRILGKPSGAEEAREMLSQLAGRDHMVYTAISAAEGEKMVVDLCATRVWMRDYTGDEIEAYIASGDPFDKAGAYAIQHVGFHPVERIEGCYACVVGLPVCHVARALRPFGFVPTNDVTTACPEHLNADSPCPAVEQIMRGGEPGQSLTGTRFEGKEK